MSSGHGHGHGDRHGGVDANIATSQRGLWALKWSLAGLGLTAIALIADGKHARVDELTSLAVVGGAIGGARGAPIADPIVGLLISLAIFKIVWDAARDIGERILDGIAPAVTDHIRTVAATTPGVQEVSDVRARWLGHTIRAEVNIAVDDQMPTVRAHHVATSVIRALRDEVDFLTDAIVHTDPLSNSGEHQHHASALPLGRAW